MAKQELIDIICAYRLQGLSYQEIAQKTGTTSDYARTVYSRANCKKKQKDETKKLKPTGYCQECGKPVNGKRRDRLFCSDKCRYDYKNRKKEHTPFICICENCGQSFIAYGNPYKRFCSSDCREDARRKR
jgi:predicted nucleic acid-binding Zn ribbon protein